MDEGLDSFLDKWRLRWPEWTLAEVFVPPDEREPALAWLCLRQELLDAAWGGSDPRPGEAKLGWWQEELQAWEQGMRRHPLGIVLQSRQVPWAVLAASLPLLAATRTQPAPARLRPVAEALATTGAALHPAAPVPAWERVATGLRAQRLAGSPTSEAVRGDSEALLGVWPGGQGAPRTLRLFEAILHGRMRVLARGGEGPPPRIRSLLSAWRAARGN